MRTISPLTFDFNKLEVTVDIWGRKLTLMGSLEQAKCRMINGRKLQEVDTEKKGVNFTAVFNTSDGMGGSKSGREEASFNYKLCCSPTLH